MKRLTTRDDFRGYQVGPAQIELRDYQRDAVDAVWDYMRTAEKSRNPLVVAPTGSGKSMICAALCHEAWKIEAGTRIVMLTHVKELVGQNEAALKRYWKDAPVGVFSAGIGRKEWDSPILFGGVQSVFRNIDKIGYADFLIVDEAHLIPRSGDGQYRQAIDSFRSMKPDIRVIGLTATPYRTTTGYLHRGEGAIFHDVCYDIPILRLMDEGHICRLTSQGGRLDAVIETDGLMKTASDYNQRHLQERATSDGSVSRAVSDICARAADRKGWLIFASGADHARMIVDEVRSKGISCELVLGDTPKAERDRLLQEYKQRKIRCMVSVGVLTTGFDAPHIDMVALLRPTTSAGLHVQMIGRGLRTCEGKDNCLVLDYSGNIERHGPLDDIRIRDRQTSEGGDAPAKRCPDCSEILATAVRACPVCGHEFPPPEINHDDRASDLPVISTDHRPDREWLDVDSVSAKKHNKVGKPPSVKITYSCGLRQVSEWVCPEHSPFMGKKAARFWGDHGGDRIETPETTEEWLERIDELVFPCRILVNNRSQFSNIVDRQFREEQELSDSSPNQIVDDLPF